MKETFIFQAIRYDGCTLFYVALDRCEKSILQTILNHMEEALIRVDLSMPPNTQVPFTRLPLLYFLLPNILSTISTITSGPPSTELSYTHISMHTSLQKLIQSVTVFFATFSSKAMKSQLPFAPTYSLI
ncbi:hypothetical protein TNCV_4050961 [Trichonephila clavipes]|nr:hypothetical protein TNCV_4050961 [Trichonephila clavipes]